MQGRHRLLVRELRLLVRTLLPPQERFFLIVPSQRVKQGIKNLLSLTRLIAREPTLSLFHLGKTLLTLDFTVRLLF